MRVVVGLTAVAAALCGNGCGGGAAALGVSSASPDRLSQWLWNLTISVPEIDVTADGLEITVSDTTCTHFAVGSVRSRAETVPTVKATLNVSIGGVGFACDGAWSFEATNNFRRPRGSGTLTASVGNSSVGASFVVGTDDEYAGWPATASLPFCETSLAIALEFEGASSLAGYLLELLEGVISRELSRSLDEQLCGWIRPLVVNNLTAVLQAGDRLLRSCEDECEATDRRLEAAAARVARLDGVLDWEASSTANSVAAVASDLATCAVRRSATRSLSRRDPGTTTFRVGTLGNATFALERANVSFASETAAAVVRTAPNASLEASLDLPGWTNLSFEFRVTATPSGPSSLLEENLAVRWDLQDLAASTTAQLAVRPATLGATSLGALTNSPGACVARSVVAVNDTVAKLTARTFGAPRILAPRRFGALESDVDETVDAIVAALFEAFPSAVDSVVNCVVDGVARGLVDDALAAILAALDDIPCVSASVSSGEELVRWNESVGIGAIDALVSADAVDFAASCLLYGKTKKKTTSPVVVVGARGNRRGIDADVSFGGLDTFSELTLLSGGDGSHHGARLESSGAIGDLTATVRLGSAATFELDANSTSWLIDAELEALAESWYAATVDDLLTLDCRLREAFASPLWFDRLKLAASSVSWNVTGYGAADATIADLLDEVMAVVSELAANYGDAILSVLNTASSDRYISQMETCYSADVHDEKKKKKFSNHKLTLLLIAVAMMVVVGVILLFYVGLVVWHSCCDATTGVEDAAASDYAEYGYEEEKANPAVFEEPPLEAALLSHQQQVPASSEDMLDNIVFSRSSDGDQPPRSCLAASTLVPLSARVVVPLLLASNAGLFVWSNATYAASVDLELTLLEHVPGVGPLHYNLGSLFKFSLRNSVHDMWKAGVYPLSFLIALCSGGWPYVKLVAMFACWVAPPCVDRGTGCGFFLDRATLCRMTPQTRELVLIWLDALGKWSLVDSYVMTLMMVAFHFHVSVGINDQNGYLDDAVVVNVYVDALPSFFIFVAATCLSLILGHAILAFHRREVSLHRACSKKEEEEEEVEEDPAAKTKNVERYSLVAHSFDEDRAVACGRAPTESRLSRDEPSSEERGLHHFDDEEEPVTLPAWTRYGVVAGLVVTLVLVCVGSDINAFDFDIRGLAGLLMGNDSKEYYSMVSLGRKVPGSFKHPHRPDAYSLSAVYFVYALAFPVILPPVLLVLWLVPMSYESMSYFFRLCEVVNAWAALDVFMLAIIASITEISQFAQFMVGDKCDAINKILKKYLNKQLHGDDKCFDVVTQIHHGSWLLFAGAILSGFLSQFVLRCAHTALEERAAREEAARRPAKHEALDATTVRDDKDVARATCTVADI
ncbi:hypothetical protein CTAYLR_003634 [Chrysophaeum taylorii]|uniref:Uncharacterized protein n=1 Tax=Chrysophaeum taylorii TaxID=2483200 RepID=A0AAD7UCG6_9STRA|nr:hypothetical protein CTAYLR_003634 [Chrysophaeum taylorii]